MRTRAKITRTLSLTLTGVSLIGAGAVSTARADETACPDFRGHYTCAEYVQKDAQGKERSAQSISELEVLQSTDENVESYTYDFNFRYHSGKRDPKNPDRNYSNGETDSSSSLASANGESDFDGYKRVCEGTRLNVVDPKKPERVELHFVETTSAGSRDYVVTVNGKEVQRCTGVASSTKVGRWLRGIFK